MSRVSDLGEPPRPFRIELHMDVASSLHWSADTLNAQAQYAADLIEAICADHADALAAADAKELEQAKADLRALMSPDARDEAPTEWLQAVRRWQDRLSAGWLASPAPDPAAGS